MDIRKFTQDVNEYEEENASTKSPNKLVQTILPIKENKSK